MASRKKLQADARATKIASEAEKESARLARRAAEGAKFDVRQEMPATDPDRFWRVTSMEAGTPVVAPVPMTPVSGTLDVAEPPRMVLGEVDLHTLRGQRTTMLDYLDMMVRRQDWHGVMDAAADLREIDAKIAVLDEIVRIGRMQAEAARKTRSA